ncbi:transcriptional regulator [Ktedonobacter sp. SOSP1-52]|uniref:MarR family winged helix-turn-helix transcriptional regulator n=1 Tax=Ktedonobacter sp. SOSP1-52 TaxID=2778366 RepID=UPI0019153CE1|nr:MarR family transcriptional regulator [Ktedonobacter sp. SOSP1-52]GHO61726.1 transcriptional regulator [Ktedonobacter sp. SOSP1-52]
MDALEDTLFRQLASACSESRQAFDQHIGMSQIRRQLLTLLFEIGEISHAALQQQLAVDGATITRLVKQFESEGVLSRRLDPQDNRYTLVSLTASGHAIAAELRAAHRAFQAQLLDGISKEEQKMMMHFFEQLRTNIRAIREISPEQT